MLGSKTIPPVLLLAFDRVDEEYYDLINILSGDDPTVTEKTIREINEKKQKSEFSDVSNKTIRVPIPIIDAIGAQHVSTSSLTSKKVDYNQNEPVLVNNTNTVTIGINIKSALSELSTSADMFYAISDQLFTRFTTSPRASFFGSTICFFNGYLRSISRQAENGTDREKLLLTFERADNYPDSGKKGETAAQSNTATSEPALEDQTGGKSSRSVAVLPDDWGTNTDGRVFLWYKLGGIEDFKAQGVPEIFSEKTINYLPYELGYTSVSMSDSDEHDIREFYHVIYDGQILPLYSLGYNPYYQNGLALFERDGVLWLGIESNES